MIKAIFLDYDGVLTTDRTGSLTTNRCLRKMSGIWCDAIKDASASYNNDLLVGRTIHEEIWNAVCDDDRNDVDGLIVTLTDRFGVRYN